ncbi:MAG: hypothetical protein IT305_15525 [Chloroflexi bacterium]|nr:hypothetical protein [Chloroflexota bacterium]
MSEAETAHGWTRRLLRASGRLALRDRLTLLGGFGAVVLGALVLLFVALRPSPAEAQQFSVWTSPQFGMTLSYPTTWTIAEQQSDPQRGDVVIIGNDVSALLVGVLHDTRSPREMAQDLIQTQKATTPDLAVIQSNETSAGSVILFMQYTVDAGTATATLIDEKALVGTLEPGTSTVTLRGMVPEHTNVEEQFDQIESIVATLAPQR